jgi:hypothetical protein
MEILEDFNKIDNIIYNPYIDDASSEVLKSIQGINYKELTNNQIELLNCSNRIFKGEYGSWEETYAVFSAKKEQGLLVDLAMMERSLATSLDEIIKELKNLNKSIEIESGVQEVRTDRPEFYYILYYFKRDL